MVTVDGAVISARAETVGFRESSLTCGKFNVEGTMRITNGGRWFYCGNVTGGLLYV
jgi:hypothetical protein